MRVGIIGAGISGLSVALRMARRGHTVDVFHREAAPGGLLATFDFAGTRVESFYHFLCGGDRAFFQLSRELGLHDRLHFADAPVGFYYDGASYDFSTALDLLRFTPIPVFQRIRFGLFALESRIRTEWRALDRLPAKPWLIVRLGQRAYDVIWDPLLGMKFGEWADRVSAAWVWHRLHRVARFGRKMGYLRGGGSGLLIDTLTDELERLGVTIHPSRPVTRILSEGGRATGLAFADGSGHACDRVVSTVPLAVLAGLLPPGWDEYAEKLRAIRYIGLACATFKLKRPVTSYFWLNVHDVSIPFNGIIEYTNLNPLDGEHIAYVPYYAPTDSRTYGSSDETLIARTWRGMKRISPDLRDDDLIASHVAREPYAQAICPSGFLNMLPAPRSPLAGLHLLDSVFLYPEDRTQSGNIVKANECAMEIEENG